MTMTHIMTMQPWKKRQGVAEVCELLDTGGAGRLDTGAVQSAVAMLGGELLPLAKVRSLLLHEHADGSIVVAVRAIVCCGCGLAVVVAVVLKRDAATGIF
jgi:hypothetical protein